MDAADRAPVRVDDKFLNVPYEQRWEHLKPVIIERYLGDGNAGNKGLTIPKLAAFMKEHYSFAAE